MYQSLLRYFADGPGSRRTWADKAGNELKHGVLPYQVVLDMLVDWFIDYINSVITKGDHQA